MNSRKIKVNAHSNEPTAHEQKRLYSLVCSRCEKSLGKTEEMPNVVVCVNCYYQGLLEENDNK